MFCNKIAPWFFWKKKEMKTNGTKRFLFLFWKWSHMWYASVILAGCYDYTKFKAGNFKFVLDWNFWYSWQLLVIIHCSVPVRVQNSIESVGRRIQKERTAIRYMLHTGSEERYVWEWFGFGFVVACYRKRAGAAVTYGQHFIQDRGILYTLLNLFSQILRKEYYV